MTGFRFQRQPVLMEVLWPRRVYNWWVTDTWWVDDVEDAVGWILVLRQDSSGKVQVAIP